MPAVPTKRPKAAAVKQASIQDTNAFLQALPDKPKEDLSLREAVEQMRDSVRAALAKGYTYQELAAMLTEKGIKISAFTLKNYVPSGRRRSSKEISAAPPQKRKRRTKAEIEAALASAAAAPVPTAIANGSAPAKVADVSAEEAPKATRGRRRATTAAKAKPEAEATVKQPTTRRRRSSAAIAKTASTTTRGRKKA